MPRRILQVSFVKVCCDDTVPKTCLPHLLSRGQANYSDELYLAALLTPVIIIVLSLSGKLSLSVCLYH